MCEIAILDPERVNPKTIADLAYSAYQQQRTALGLIAVMSYEDRFTYAVEKWLEPDPEDIDGFVNGLQDITYRFIIHARLATSGQRDELVGAHPIDIDCPECDVDYVVHNGHIRSFAQDRAAHEAQDHEYVSDVDTEAIAHELGDVPAANSGAEIPYTHEPAYVVMNEDRIMMVRSSWYDASMNFELAKRRRNVIDDTTDYEIITVDATAAPTTIERDMPAEPQEAEVEA